MSHTTKILLTVFLAFYFTKSANCQASITNGEQVILKASYDLLFRPDSTSNIEQRESMSLLIGKSFSRFMSQSAQKKDSLLNSTYGTPVNEQTIASFNKQLELIPGSLFKFRIYKYYAEQKIHYIDNVNSTYYENAITIKSLIWKIFSNDTLTVSGYTCKRATTRFAGRSYEAWFTDEIPISDGPYKFCGLPGLIIKVGDSKNQFSFQLTNLRDLHNSPRYIQPFGRKTIITDMPSIYNAQRNLALQVQNAAPEAGIQVSEERRNAIRQRLKRSNNSIELK